MKQQLNKQVVIYVHTKNPSWIDSWCKQLTNQHDPAIALRQSSRHLRIKDMNSLFGTLQLMDLVQMVFLGRLAERLAEKCYGIDFGDTKTTLKITT